MERGRRVAIRARAYLKRPDKGRERAGRGWGKEKDNL